MGAAHSSVTVFTDFSNFQKVPNSKEAMKDIDVKVIQKLKRDLTAHIIEWTRSMDYDGQPIFRSRFKKLHICNL